MRLKRRTQVTTKETCAFVACFLLVFFSISQILVISNRTSGINATVGKRQISGDSVAHTMKAKLPSAKIRELKSQKIVRAPVQTPPSASRIKNRARLQNELRRMEKSLTLLVRQNPMPPEDASAHFQTEVSVIQLKEMIRKSEEGLVKLNHSAQISSVRRWSPIRANRTRWFDDEPSEETSNDTSIHPYDDSFVPSSTSSSLNHDLKFMSERGIKRRDVLNDITALLQQDQHFRDMDHSEDYDLEATVTKGLVGQREGVEEDEDENSVDFNSPYWDIVKDDLQEETQDGKNKLCKEVPDGLVGQTPDVRLDRDIDVNEIIKSNSDIKEGGEWKPTDCISRHRLAIIVPYRDRWSHLKVLLHYLLPVLKRQQIHFRLFVVEQFGNQTFNKGRIMNAAFREAMKLFNFQCVTFHDVDLVPEDDRNMYTCAEQPKHMSTAIDKFSYRLPYQGLVGGVLSFRAEHFQTVNGYSNMYWGWGGEDDDMTVRILHRGLRIFRPPSNVARYKMVKHGSRQLSELRLKLLRTAARRSRVEGLNNVPYKLLFTHLEKLFTHFMVDVGKP